MIFNSTNITQLSELNILNYNLKKKCLKENLQEILCDALKYFFALYLWLS